MIPVLGLSAAICLLSAAGGMAADFDGDGVADEFTITRDAAKAAKGAAVRLANPWEKTKQAPKGLGLIVKLSRAPQTYLLHDPTFFKSPMWLESKPAAEVIAKKDRRYAAWKKQVPALQGDAIQLGTEAGIDILLYWNGKEWRLFWPKEDP
jgi:hypothetical protein